MGFAWLGATYNPIDVITLALRLFAKENKRREDPFTTTTTRDDGQITVASWPIAHIQPPVWLSLVSECIIGRDLAFPMPSAVDVDLSNI